MKLIHYTESHTGMRRPQNEDACGARPDAGLFVVADGMGGHKGGEVASRLIVDRFLEAAHAVGFTVARDGSYRILLDGKNVMAPLRLKAGDHEVTIIEEEAVPAATEAKGAPSSPGVAP